jgi:hypothetical protein
MFIDIQCSIGLSPPVFSPIAKILVCPDFPHYTAKLSFRHRFSDTKVVKPIKISPLVPPTATFWQLCIDW